MITLLTLSMLSLPFAGCAEYQAGRLYDDAQQLIAEDRIPEAVDKYETIIRKYPGTKLAAQVTKELEFYRDFAGVIQRYPAQHARDLMVTAARAIDRFRQERGVYPESLEALVPGYLEQAPRDPWNRPLLYLANAGRDGYRMISRGSDGKPGGEGEAADLMVEDGEFVTRAMEAATAILPSGAAFQLEIAADPESRAMGYMFREEIGPREGMLFLLEADDRHRFWMKNCKVELDMVWLDERFRVLDISHRQPPCPETGECPWIQPSRPARHVLEFPGGTAEAEGLTVGAQIEILPQ